MPRAGEGRDGQDGVGKTNVEPEVAPWEMVTREALTEVGAEKRVEEVALHSAERRCSELKHVWLHEGETWLEVVYPTWIDGCERSTSPICLQTPLRTTRRGLMSSA